TAVWCRRRSRSTAASSSCVAAPTKCWKVTGGLADWSSSASTASPAPRNGTPPPSTAPPSPSASARLARARSWSKGPDRLQAANAARCAGGSSLPPAELPADVQDALERGDVRQHREHPERRDHQAGDEASREQDDALRPRQPADLAVDGRLQPLGAGPGVRDEQRAEEAAETRLQPAHTGDRAVEHVE